MDKFPFFVSSVCVVAPYWCPRFAARFFTGSIKAPKKEAFATKSVIHIVRRAKQIARSAWSMRLFHSHKMFGREILDEHVISILVVDKRSRETRRFWDGPGGLFLIGQSAIPEVWVTRCRMSYLSAALVFEVVVSIGETSGPAREPLEVDANSLALSGTGATNPTMLGLWGRWVTIY